jgi:hypothetical protein
MTEHELPAEEITTEEITTEPEDLEVVAHGEESEEDAKCADFCIIN